MRSPSSRRRDLPPVGGHSEDHGRHGRTEHDVSGADRYGERTRRAVSGRNAVAYPDDLLGEGEHVVVHKHPHWKMLVLPVTSFLVTVGVASYLAALVRDFSWHGIAWVALAGVAGVSIIWFTLVPLIRWRTTHFVVTSERVMVREGVLRRTGIDIPLSRINSVRFEHGLIDRLLGCGTLIIESAADEPLEFDDIPQVERVHSLLYREIDSDPDDGFGSFRSGTGRREVR